MSWHKIAGYDVFLNDDGRITKIADGYERRYAYTPKGNAWEINQNLTPQSFRRRIKNGTIIIN